MLTFSIILLVAVAGLLAYAASRPDSFRIERSAVIQAPPARVHALIDSFDAWQSWSPWEKKDPAMKRERGGPATGKGATYAWEGNKNVGKGRMEIVDSTPPDSVRIKLDFLAPFEAHNMAEFTIVPEGAGSRVNWAMYGPSPFVSKLMGVFFNFDAMVGKDFEEGLANLKARAEKV